MENGRYYIYYDAYPNQGDKIENVTEKPMITITGLKITSEARWNRTQCRRLFSAQTTPAGNVDDSGIGWYVNSVRKKRRSTANSRVFLCAAGTLNVHGFMRWIPKQGD